MTPTNRVALPLACALSLACAAGCMVGPDFQRPDPKAPGGFVSLAKRPTTGPAATQESTTSDRPANLAQWWRTFNDPTLDGLVADAMANNLDLAQAESRLRQARAQRAIATGQLWPSVDLAGSYRRSGTGRDDSNDDATTGVLGNSSGNARDSYQIGFDAAWEIDVFGGQRRGVEVADATLRANIADIQDVRVTLASEVAVTYFQARAARQRIGFAERNLQVQQKSLEVTRKRFGGGLESGLDLAQAEAQIASTRSAIPALEQAARLAVFDLALLLGQEPAQLVARLGGTDVPLPITPPEVPAGLPSDLLRRRPDVRRAEEQLHAATANIGVATADLFPRFTLTGSFGTADSKPKRLFNWANTIWSFGPNVSWNIFDGNRIRANIALTEAQRDEAFIVYRRTVLTALRDAEQSLTAYDFEQQRRVNLRQAVEANRRAVDISQRLYAQGQVEFVSLLTAQQALLATEDALVQSDQQVAANLVAIYKALGGGWEETPGQQQP